MKDGKFQILCIDDDPDLLLVLRSVLEKAGYLVEQAQSGEEGLAAFRNARPDLVIVDLMMEEVDAGRNLVKEVRLLDREVPIFMLSSVGDALSRNVDFADLGLAGVFQKPIEPNTLVATLKVKLKPR